MQLFEMAFKGTRRKENTHALSDINVTPFVDVALVLLVIFMITAPLLQYGMDVQLPKAEAPIVEVRQIPTVSVKPDKKIFWDQDELQGLDMLMGRVRQYAGEDKDKEIYFRADKKLDYGFVVEVFAAIRNSGIQNIGMATDGAEIAQ